MFTDPTGMSKDGIEHDYRLNRDGSFTLLDSNDDNFDRIFANDDNQAPLIVEKSFLQTLSKPKYEGTYEAKISEKTLKTYGKSLFDFFSNNSDVEWKYSEFYNSKSDERFANILTSFKEGYIRNPNYYIEDILDSDINNIWTFTIHNHPGEMTTELFYPSGWKYNSKNNLIPYQNTDGSIGGDRGGYNYFKNNSNYSNRMPKYFHIKSPYLNKILKHDEKSIIRIN